MRFNAVESPPEGMLLMMDMPAEQSTADDEGVVGQVAKLGLFGAVLRAVDRARAGRGGTVDSSGRRAGEADASEDDPR